MLIPIVKSTESSPFLAHLFIIFALPIIGLFALSIPAIPILLIYFIIQNVIKKKHQKAHYVTRQKHQSSVRYGDNR